MLLLVTLLVIIFKHFSEHFNSSTVVLKSSFPPSAPPLFFHISLILPKQDLFYPFCSSEFITKFRTQMDAWSLRLRKPMLLVSGITFPCVIGCRIWPSPSYLNGPSRLIRSMCGCIFCPFPTRSAIVRLQHIQWDGF